MARGRLKTPSLIENGHMPDIDGSPTQCRPRILLSVSLFTIRQPSVMRRLLLDGLLRQSVSSKSFHFDDLRGWVVLIEAGASEDPAIGERLSRETQALAARSGDLDLELCELI